MERICQTSSRRNLLGAAIASCVLWTTLASGNGGPFVVKYPAGDPAAKGVLARLAPDLRPAREEKLRVVKEDLTISFLPEAWSPRGGTQPPLAHVSAAYRIRNPLDEEVKVDFGFPILRGIYMHPLAMMPRPDVRVSVDGRGVKATILSNSVIYGIIRNNAHETIERALRSKKALASLVQEVRKTSGASREKARAALKTHVKDSMGWNVRDASLLLEYVCIDFGKPLQHHPWDARSVWTRDNELRRIPYETLGLLSAIGERKATQLLAHLGTLLDPESGSAYEKIFSAWGGDIRERSVDLSTGKVRPREISLESLTPDVAKFAKWQDPAVYARVDYLDANEKLSTAEKASLQTILKNLPVVFTFAPMNLLHYEVTFEPGTEKTVTVSYRQYAYVDTRAPSSYQIAYVIHPASLWDHFGPIHLNVEVPEGVELAASVPLKKTGTTTRTIRESQVPCATYSTIVEDKTGELFTAIDMARWKSAMGKQSLKPATQAASLIRGKVK